MERKVVIVQRQAGCLISRSSQDEPLIYVSNSRPLAPMHISISSLLHGC